jgi:tetratricopeptide (TPR) repeat protein
MDALQENSGNDELSQSLEVGDYHKILTSTRAQALIGKRDDRIGDNNMFPRAQYEWIEDVSGHIQYTLESESGDRELAKQEILTIGVASLHAFLQSNVTGPPLGWDPAHVLFPASIRDNADGLKALRRKLIGKLTVDGETVYRLTPHVELFSLASVILNHPSVVEHNTIAHWGRLRVNFWHQRMLSELSPSLQQVIFDDLKYLDSQILASNSAYKHNVKVELLLERAAVHTYHGFDKRAKEGLDRAAKLNGFEYVLTGRLGKRTKFQSQDLSQLVVLAQSSDEPAASTDLMEGLEGATQPENLKLDDDTLLEAIDFSKPSEDLPVQDTDPLPPSLASLDPSNQPPLHPFDSIILLSLASSITNTSPQHGLTREETLPYATRVLDGGSTNWQIYTQALLVRSRIEGYRSRTIERSVLQLQALVDQVIAETTAPDASGKSSVISNGTQNTTSSTFLPRPKPSESAPVSERLKYIHQLATPTRWTLESELAARWVSLGGLRTALEIYERLEMWAEAALCWAAVEREDKARKIVRRQLYHSSFPGKSTNALSFALDEEDEDKWEGKERDSLPLDAPRLFCILGDIDKDPTLYDRAWVVSNNRYARAQRSLGQHYLAINQLEKADEAYSKSLKINPQNQRAWFALGCVRLELQNWRGAVDAFGRSVQIDSEDAESWSNLAAALLRLPPDEVSSHTSLDEASDQYEVSKPPKKDHIHEAFVALKRAAALKRDSYRIWQNVINVAATISPPPYADIVIAQERLIELRGSAEGESCVDVEVVEGLLAHVIVSNHDDGSKASADGHQRGKYGLEHMITDLVQKKIVPLITHSPRLWRLVARLSLHLNRPSSALDAYEKAWRSTQNIPGWENGLTGEKQGADTPEKAWNAVVEATIDLADAYESLGERERTEGLGAGSGELVCKQWKFKSRSAVRGVMGKARERWEGSEGWGKLEERLAALT